MPIYLTDVVGWIAGVLEVYAFQEKTMIPLRIAAVFACLFGFAYGYLSHAYPSMAVSLVLLPLNLWRLKELRRLIADSGASVIRQSNYEWLRPFMHRADFRAGDVLFRKGEVGDAAFLIGAGDVRIPEHKATVGAGGLLGEIGLLTAGHIRTATAICQTDVRAWRISFAEMEQLCLQDSKFCLHLARIIVQRYQANLQKSAETPAAIGDAAHPA
ncbi:MAG: cyclic nucleotide-binding domain-containing protein [Bradyrhizobium sp.]|nr:MAG: cyclic nucleotide-binding domain-containing protein [Bradyrhizobium sp.]